MPVDVDVAAAVGEVWFKVAVGPSPLLLFNAYQLQRKFVEVPGKRWKREVSQAGDPRTAGNSSAYS